MQIHSKLLRLRTAYWISGGTLILLAAQLAQGQTWAPTATKALGPSLVNATELGPLDGSTPLHIVVGLNVRNGSQIPVLLKAMVTPGNPQYGQPLTFSEFVTQFAPTSAQVQAAENYLSSQGFTNLAVSDNMLLIEGDATAANVQSAFNTSLASFSQNGQTIFANTTPAQVPSSLSGIVVAVLGLNNLATMQPPLAKKGTDPCTFPGCPPPSVTNTTFTPQQYQIAYDAAYPGSTPSATSLKPKVNPACKTPIGSIAEGDIGCFNKSSGCPVPTSSSGPGKAIVVSGTPSANSTGVLKDLYSYWHAYNLPLDPVTAVYTGIPTPDTSGAEEWDLDSQTSTGIAQQVARYYFYVASSLTDSDLALAISKYASDGKAKLMSISLGECEGVPFTDGSMLVDDMSFAEAALQGQTTFVSSDDNGSACPVAPTNGVPGSGPPMVSYPASSPYVIAVGATDLFTNANYTYDYELGAEFSGGGISAFETSPFWESTAVPSAAAGQRGLPDTAMCGEPNFCGAIIFTGASPSTGAGSTSTCCVGGTSLSSPLAMGAYARIETAHGNTLGFAGPLIYELSSGSAPGPGQTILYFNDVTAGPNGVYEATPGWDYVTGLGSWDILALNQHFPTSYNH